MNQEPREDVPPMRTRYLDHVVPSSLILSRLEKHLEQLRRDLDQTPWWRMRRRLILMGGCAAYRYEIEELLRMTASSQPSWVDSVRRASRER